MRFVRSRGGESSCARWGVRESSSGAISSSGGGFEALSLSHQSTFCGAASTHNFRRSPTVPRILPLSLFRP